MLRNSVLAATAAAALLSSGAAHAQEAEVFIDEVGCGVFDADGMLHIITPPGVFPYDGDAVVQKVLTGNGSAKITCNGTLPESAFLPGDFGSSNRAVILGGPDNGVCNIGFGGGSFVATDDWHNVVTKSGRVTLTCHINVNL